MAITANQVTILRIFLLPFPIYFVVYGTTSYKWLAFVLLLFIAATDFVDGLMARREGPTILGSLLDPVADKIFVSAVILSCTLVGIFPEYAAIAILLREFLLTAVRSSMANRNALIKTSLLGKLKTIIQMGGFGTIFLTTMLPKWGVFFVHLALALPFLFLAAIQFYKGKKLSFWALPVFASFILVAFLGILTTKDLSIHVQALIIIAITWISAFDYLKGAVKIIKKTGPLLLGDWLRILWAITLSVYVCPLVFFFPITILPILVCIALEFGIGGIDNIVTSQDKILTNFPFAFSLVYCMIYALLLNLFSNKIIIISPLYLSIALALTSSINCGYFFGRNSQIFFGKEK